MDVGRNPTALVVERTEARCPLRACYATRFVDPPDDCDRRVQRHNSMIQIGTFSDLETLTSTRLRGSSPAGQITTVGANWSVNPNVRRMVNYAWVVNDDENAKGDRRVRTPCYLPFSVWR
jgi:hypothetical protein